MANGKRNRMNSLNRAGLCAHIKDGKCKRPSWCGTKRCAKNKCQGFKDPKKTKHKK
jgi:hypothetical protein